MDKKEKEDAELALSNISDQINNVNVTGVPTQEIRRCARTEINDIILRAEDHVNLLNVTNRLDAVPCEQPTSNRCFPRIQRDLVGRFISQIPIRSPNLYEDVSVNARSRQTSTQVSIDWDEIPDILRTRKKKSARTNTTFDTDPSEHVGRLEQELYRLQYGSESSKPGPSGLIQRREN